MWKATPDARKRDEVALDVIDLVDVDLPTSRPERAS
jgi:hypothetical protein